MAEFLASLRAALVTLPLVLAGAAEWDPQILTLIHPDRAERVPATSPRSCAAALGAIREGRWLPLGGRPVETHCRPGNLFAPGSDKIKGGG